MNDSPLSWVLVQSSRLWDIPSRPREEQNTGMRLRWEVREPLLGLEPEPGAWYLVVGVSTSHLLGSPGVLNPNHVS